MTIDLDSLSALLAAATPRPWDHGGSTPTEGEEWIWERTHHATTDPDAPATRIACCGAADARLIVALVNDATSLLAELRAAREVVAKTKALRDWEREGWRADPGHIDETESRLTGEIDDALAAYDALGRKEGA
jgi:hypothetical protein